MGSFTVITTIHPKTRALELFEALPGRSLIVVGDRKSHPMSDSKRLTYLSLETQRRLHLKTSAASPLNHYARKNVGYLHAIGKGATVIYDTDDDNLPYEKWAQPREFLCDSMAGGDSKFVNIYRYFTNEHIWPRGFPLDEIRVSQPVSRVPARLKIGVWQGLADDEPDVDAIWRLTLNKRIIFQPGEPVGIKAGCYCPFNSQNTFWSGEVFPLLYLPTTVRFRFTDILRGYIAQRLMWENSCHLGFVPACVYQERNAHDCIEDFKDEIDCYLRVKSLVSLLDSLSLTGDYRNDLRDVYSALARNDFVAHDELKTLDAWLSDLDSVGLRADRDEGHG